MCLSMNTCSSKVIKEIWMDTISTEINEGLPKQKDFLEPFQLSWNYC